MAEAVVNIEDSTFEETVLKADKPVFVDFGAEWCPPCKRIEPFVEELGGDYDGKAVVAKVDVDKAPNTAARFGITSVPTLVVFKNGEIVETAVGAVPKDQMAKMIDKHL